MSRYRDADGFDRSTWRWQLLGPDDSLTPGWLAELLDSHGTISDWASIGLPLKLDAFGHPESFRVWGRFWSVALISGEEAEDYPACRDAGVLVPNPLPEDEPEDFE